MWASISNCLFALKTAISKPVNNRLHAQLPGRNPLARSGLDVVIRVLFANRNRFELANIHLNIQSRLHVYRQYRQGRQFSLIFMTPRVALITGASSGIGATFARKLAQRGFELILVARRADRLAEFARTLPSRTQTIAADLATEEGLRATEQAIAACPNLELLVNNAGFGTLGRFWKADIAGQDTMHRLHVLATVRLTHAALAGMTVRSSGAVINVSSVAAFAHSEGNASYCATKAWMNSFTEGLDMELRGAGSPVRVQALCPGFTVTEFHDTLGVDRNQIPAWLWMTSDEVVDASLRGLERNQVVVIPGWKYRAAATLMKHLPWSIGRRLRRPGKDTRV